MSRPFALVILSRAEGIPTASTRRLSLGEVNDAYWPSTSLGGTSSELGEESGPLKLESSEEAAGSPPAGLRNVREPEVTGAPGGASLPLPESVNRVE